MDVEDMLEEEDAQDDVVDHQDGLELDKGPWHCRISVNSERVCVKHGWNRLEVETAAAEEAVAILKARKVPQGGANGIMTRNEEEEEEEEGVKWSRTYAKPGCWVTASTFSEMW